MGGGRHDDAPATSDGAPTGHDAMGGHDAVAHGRRQPRVGRWLGRLSLVSAARPWTVIAILAVATLGVGLGMTQLETDADLLKILPKDHPTTHAAQNASQEFRGFYDFVTVFYEIDPEKCQHASDTQLPNRVSPADCSTITDEVYVRGMDEIGRFIHEEIPYAEYQIDLANIIKVVNWTNSGYDISDPEAAILYPVLSEEPQRIGQPRDEAFSLPDTSPKGSFLYYLADQGARAADDSVDDSVSETYEVGRTLIFFDTETADRSRVELGDDVFAMVDAYQLLVEACDDQDPATECVLKWNVFTNDGLAVRGISSVDAHASEVTQQDISKLAPIIIWAIIIVLYLAFRDTRVILVSAANLLVSFLWTAGLMGWLSIPFSALNMTIVPLILGVGIDYGIHMVSEFLEHKAEGMDNTRAFQIAGNRAGLAMGIATVTTSTGLMLMIFSPSILMAQLGIVSSIAMVVTFLFTLTLIPALLTLTRKGVTGRMQAGSVGVVRLARAVSKQRVPVMVFVILMTGAAAVSLGSLQPEGFGNPELNYPPGDRVRDDAQFVFDKFYGGQDDAQANFLVLEGDMTLPENHEFIRALMRGLEEHEVIQGFSVASLTRIVEAWVAIDQGTPDAIVNQFILGQMPPEYREGTPLDPYPQTQEDIQATFDAIFASPMANFMTVLLNEDYTMATVTYDTFQSLEFDAVEEIWLATQEVIEQAREETGVTSVQVTAHPFGNNAFSYLFITEEQPWVNTIGLVSFGMVIVMIALLTRNVKATACTAAVMGVTSIWWLGSLPLIGVGLSVGLMLPMIFIMAIGTDDAVHLIWNMEQSGQRERVYRFVGKAVLLTSITTVVAFGIFSQQTDLLVTRTLLATTLAVVVMWAATMLIVPLFYPPEPLRRGTVRPERPAADGHRHGHAEAPAPTTNHTNLETPRSR